jgi:hypothetical protein
VGFVVDKVTLGQVFSEYFGFPCQFSFHLVLHIHHHLSSGAGTIGQLVADVASGLSLTPPQETKKKKPKNPICSELGMFKLEKGIQEQNEKCHPNRPNRPIKPPTSQKIW